MNTHHAEVRMQQRGIPPHVVSLLLDYGREQHDHRGAVIHYLDKRSMRRLRKDHRRTPISELTRYRDVYLVERDGFVLTVGHRFKRIKRL